MSETEPKKTPQTMKEATESMKDIIDALVPPSTVEVTDVFGILHIVPATCSARAQIKIMRMIEKIKDLELPEGLNTEGMNVNDIAKILSTLVMNEAVFETVCKCAELAHPKLIAKVKDMAQAEDVEYDPELPVADLFPIEEAIAMIVPLFLRIARRTGQAIQKIAEAT